MEASEELEKLIALAPKGDRAADSLLQLGLIAGRLGSTERAQGYFDRLKKDMPDSVAARHIPESHSAR